MRPMRRWTHQTRGQCRILKICLLMAALAVTAVSTPAFAKEDLGQEWVKAMNACEMLVSKQSFAGFQNYVDASSTLNVELRLERGFEHPVLSLNVSTISDGSAWFMCVVTGDTRDEQGAIIGTVTGTLFAQIRDQGNISMVFGGGKTLAPVRVICRDGGQLTSVLA